MTDDDPPERRGPANEEGGAGEGREGDDGRGGEARRRDDSRGDDNREDDDRESGGGASDRVALAISVLFGVSLAVGSILLVTWLDPTTEGLLRIHPTVSGGGVGAGWAAGNENAALNALIALVHLADVVMGLFILVMVFLHWAAFRRLAARMQPPGGRSREASATATDGGERPSRRAAAANCDGDSTGRDGSPGHGGDREGRP